MKCYKCKHYYCDMTGAGGYGYNPYPSCHYLEDTGNWPNILTQDCFKKRRQVKLK